MKPEQLFDFLGVYLGQCATDGQFLLGIGADAIVSGDDYLGRPEAWFDAQRSKFKWIGWWGTFLARAQGR